MTYQNIIFQGITTALITPMGKDDNIDYKALELLIDRQIEAKIDKILLAGSTGEGSSLTDEEYYKLIKRAADYAAKSRISVIAAVAGVATYAARERVLNLCKYGIDGLMCTVPHYIRPEQEGIYRHFETLNDVSDLPIMIYLHPGRTGADMSDDTILRLASLKQIVAIKDASADIEKPLRLLPAIDKDFAFLTGDDGKLLAHMSYGGVGSVSVIANIFPKICKKIFDLAITGKSKEALKLQHELMPLIVCICRESNPIGVKHAMYELKLCTDEIRLPLTKARSSTAKEIDEALKKLIDLEKNV